MIGLSTPRTGSVPERGTEPVIRGDRLTIVLQTGFISRLRKAAQVFVNPLEEDRRLALEARWNSLDPRWRTPYQAFGSKITGCAATIGLHPRCDFSCTGCYLGDEANRIAPFPLADIMSQLDRIRSWTGAKGSVQITDGEVTLRPYDELVAVLRRAHELDLVPMLMTHGDTLRSQPDLLMRLAVDAGLTEISIHIDTTMRGRTGYRQPPREEDLQPLREEFATMVRRVRRETGRDVRAATTMTVTRDNLAGLAHVTRWSADNRDAFRMLSLQPLADVGRTREELRGVDIEDVWREIARGLAGYTDQVGDGGPIHVGHPACNRVASFLCFETPGDGNPPRFLKTVRSGADEDREFIEALRRTGLMGVGYRDDPKLVGLARKAGAIAQGLPFVLGPGRRFLASRIRSTGHSLPGFVARAALGRIKVDGFSVVSHHFMGREEFATPLGQERLAACVFRIPVGDRMVSMCEVNVAGIREAVYASNGTQ